MVHRAMQIKILCRTYPCPT